ncbi:eukaryotic translation initiation factor 4 gamma [Anaeramoeba flamelloides]|uniref:Eukaryotic translation initiation factor 4 gamma n=1 Tax=Anaeramoeba flamelloides TaxID=1746091 RepID=A0ABQ8XCS0_9EUKA|nr:eukaryotic translation initiation factor 4 gamma [Anaeramoeba flamelloides]
MSSTQQNIEKQNTSKKDQTSNLNQNNEATLPICVECKSNPTHFYCPVEKLHLCYDCNLKYHPTEFIYKKHQNQIQLKNTKMSLNNHNINYSEFLINKKIQIKLKFLKRKSFQKTKPLLESGLRMQLKTPNRKKTQILDNFVLMDQKQMNEDLDTNSDTDFDIDYDPNFDFFLTFDSEGDNTDEEERGKGKKKENLKESEIEKEDNQEKTEENDNEKEKEKEIEKEIEKIEIQKVEKKDENQGNKEEEKETEKQENKQKKEEKQETEENENKEDNNKDENQGNKEEEKEIEKQENKQKKEEKQETEENENKEDKNEKNQDQKILKEEEKEIENQENQQKSKENLNEKENKKENEEENEKKEKEIEKNQDQKILNGEEKKNNKEEETEKEGGDQKVGEKEKEGQKEETETEKDREKVDQKVGDEEKEKEKEKEKEGKKLQNIKSKSEKDSENDSRSESESGSDQDLDSEMSKNQLDFDENIEIYTFDFNPEVIGNYEIVSIILGNEIKKLNKRFKIVNKFEEFDENSKWESKFYELMLSNQNRTIQGKWGKMGGRKIYTEGFHEIKFKINNFAMENSWSESEICIGLIDYEKTHDFFEKYQSWDGTFSFETRWNSNNSGKYESKIVKSDQQFVDQKYGSPFKTGDYVSIYLDMSQRNVSFGVNNQNFGIAWENIPESVIFFIRFYSLDLEESFEISLI